MVKDGFGDVGGGVFDPRGGWHAGGELSIGRWMALEWAGPLSSPSNWNLNRW